MSKLQEKLRENKNRRLRENFICSASDRLASFLSSTSYTSNPDVKKFAAYSAWDFEKNKWTTTRGTIKNLKLFYFSNWHELINKLQSITIKSEYDGWFYLNCDGPYYKMTNKEFLSFIEDLKDYCIKFDTFDMVWLGDKIDTAIITEYNHEPLSQNEFELYYW